MPLAITPVDYWRILCDMGFLSATSMSATYRAATITRMNTAYAAMAVEAHDFTKGEGEDEGGGATHRCGTNDTHRRRGRESGRR